MNLAAYQGHLPTIVSIEMRRSTPKKCRSRERPSFLLEKKFIATAAADGMGGLKGHRSVGGCRASIYNAMPLEGAKTLAEFMGSFAAKNG